MSLTCPKPESAALRVQKLELRVARYNRARFGHPSEKPDQLLLELENLEADPPAHRTPRSPPLTGVAANYSPRVQSDFGENDVGSRMILRMETTRGSAAARNSGQSGSAARVVRAD